ncbi:MAG: MerR family transcriptional regulator [Agathobacter sp.]|nr:MerR family transcriptional regulator [Agathobacter sp.]
MSENNSINQVEKITGVTKRNIRFYEKEGLLAPKRNDENGYRVYDANDIWRIKVIKMLRMLDMPLEEIKSILEEEQLLGEAVVRQQAELERKAKELHAAISFCEKLKGAELETLDVEECLMDIERTGPEGFFMEWVEDYKRVVAANQDMDFTFVPDTAITNEREFTDALFQYANQENVDLVITKESMYPEFTINGVEYVAERNYSYMSRIPVAVVSCHRKDREIKGEGIEKTRKNLQWFWHNWGFVIIGVVLYMILVVPIVVREGMFLEGVLILLSLLSVYGAMFYRQKLLHFNDKTK